MISSNLISPISVGEFVASLNKAFHHLQTHLIGEISSLRVKPDQYAFFDLKDLTQDITITCFLSHRIQHQPIENGMQVIISGTPYIYPKTGRFSFNIDNLQIQGEGNLLRSFELLITKLKKQGLFDRERKRILAPFPQRLAVISSPDA